MLLNCSRQSGKSTTTAIIGLHRALYHPRSLVLMISPSLRQSRELFGKVQAFMKTMTVQPRLGEDNRLSMELENGSRVVALPGDGATIRGFSAPSLIIEDEAAYVDDGLAAG
jgi:phage terminase large subunit-like protein